MLISSPYQRHLSKQRVFATVGGNSPEYDLFNRESEEDCVKLSKSSMVHTNLEKMLFNDRSSTIEKGSVCSLTLQSVDRINTSLESVLGVGFAFPFASSTATSTINTLTVATTTPYTVYSPFSNYVEDTRGTITTYLTLNGQLIGTYSYQQGQESTTGKVTYVLTNYLGTPVLETDDKGDIVEMDMTDVFGNYVYRDQRNDNAYHNNGYTGHEFDDVTGLTYAHARYLDTTAHSFLSVDPLLYSMPQNYLTDPQQMNSYAYARNNPVIYNDPTGMFGISTFTNIPSGIVSGLVDMAKGVFNLLSGPIKTGQAMGQSIKSAINNPSQVASGISKSVSNFFGASDASQGKMIGSVLAGFAVPEGKEAGLATELRNGAEILSETEKPSTLFHYTSDKGLNGILDSGKINPSTMAKSINDARLGDGQYFSDILPGTKSNSSLAQIFTRVRFQGDKYRNFIEISTKGLDVAASLDRPGVYLIPNSEPLDILSRVIRFGDN